ncbi:DUF3617 domain-containing protein [Massilia sp. erpn]|uniref:DUF3617 domain-containing protein n=1 Tax=Massilia sp. erpn TaxID=2738142 RepID=UPI0021025A78|nr:DUF3617 domain-containing protein [Massilia sp. erpn]UTY60380.1 DUF3617 domain-containing protein [Massilia sp. erpn]
MPFRPTLLACALLLVGSSAGAQTLKPGLWEMNNRIAGGSPETMQAMARAQKEMANLPADQRKMLEQMMAQRGVGLNLGDGGGVKLTYCMTKEMAEKRELPAGQPGDCRSTSTPVPGGVNVSFHCNKPPSQGKGQVIFEGDTGYTMRMDVTSSAHGAPQQMMVEGSGRWLSADCGAAPKPR